MLPSSGREAPGRALVLNVPVLVLLPFRSRDSFCPPGKSVPKTKELASEGRPSSGSLTAEEQEKEQEKVGWPERDGWMCLLSEHVSPRRSWDQSSEWRIQICTEENPMKWRVSLLACLQIRELQERIQKAAACTCLLPLGRDRLYRRYWLLPSAATLFVEDDCFGLTEEMLQPQQSSELDTKSSLEEEEVKAEPAEGR